MEPDIQTEPIVFLKRVTTSDYLENQTVTVTVGGTPYSDTVENLLKGSDLIAYECLIEGKRVVLLGFESKE